MFTTIHFLPVVQVVSELNDSNKHLACSVYQWDAQDFNLNEAGFPRNSISQLARAQSQSEYDSIMRRLVELKQEGGISDDTTVEQAISMIKPRYCQSPNEIEQFIQWTNGDVMTRLDEAYAKTVKDVKVDEKSVEPAAQSVDA